MDMMEFKQLWELLEIDSTNDRMKGELYSRFGIDNNIVEKKS